MEDRFDPVAREAARDVPTRVYEPPRFEVISLDCEITAYAPDDNTPFF